MLHWFLWQTQNAHVEIQSSDLMHHKQARYYYNIATRSVKYREIRQTHTICSKKSLQFSDIPSRKATYQLRDSSNTTTMHSECYKKQAITPDEQFSTRATNLVEKTGITWNIWLIFYSRERAFIHHNARKRHQCWRPNKTTTKIQKYKCNKNLPNLVSTVINTPTVISQYLFTSADKTK